MSKTLIVAGAVVLIAVGWFGNQVFGPKERPRETVAVDDPAVAVGVAKTVEFNPATEYVGHVEPIQETDILPQIDGYVKKVCFTEGAFVRAGDVLSSNWLTVTYGIPNFATKSTISGLRDASTTRSIDRCSRCSRVERS